MREAATCVVNIVTWNSRAYLPNLLASLDGQDTRDFTITMVDNASSDDTLAWCAENHPDVAVLRNFRNQGFSRAHNQAISLAFSRWQGENLAERYVLVANPDLEFAPDSLRRLMAYMDEHPEVAACGPKLLRARTRAAGDDERREVERTTVIDSTGLVIRKSRRVVDRGAGEEDRGQYDAATEVFGLSGACVMFRASAIMEASIDGEFFDEDFFAYKEDVDIAWRMRRLGLAAHLVPDAVVWHHRRVGHDERAGWLKTLLRRRRRSPFINFLSTRNHGWVFIKNDTFANLMIHLPWWLPYEFGKFLMNLASWSAIKGEFASLAGIPRMLGKRANVSARAKRTSTELRRWFM